MFHNYQIEKDAISSAIYDADCVIQLLELDKDDFHLPDNRKIYNAIEKLYNANSTISINGVYDELLITDSTLAETFLNTQLGSVDCHSFHMEYYVKTIRKYSNKRKIYFYLDDATKEIKKGKDLEKIIDDIEKGVRDIDNLDVKYGTFADDDIDDNINMEGEYFKTGLDAIDDNCMGLYRGTANVIGARRKEGKSTLAFNIAQHISQKKDALYFSMEMKRKELFLRLLAMESDICMNDIKSGKGLSQAKKHIPRIKEKYRRIKVYDNINKFHLIKGECRKQAKKLDIGLIVIDYLQLINVQDESDLRKKTVIITRELKQLAMELNVPILELSQFARNDENEWPKMSWFKESGSIEEDADLMIFLHTEKKKDEEDKQWLIIPDGRSVDSDLNRVKHLKGFFKFIDYVEV